MSLTYPAIPANPIDPDPQQIADLVACDTRFRRRMRAARREIAKRAERADDVPCCALALPTVDHRPATATRTPGTAVDGRVEAELEKARREARRERERRGEGRSK